MDTVLEHLVEITGHRDHTLLDSSVLSALHQLGGASEVRSLEMFSFRGELYLRQRVMIKSGKVIAVEDDHDGDQCGEKLARHPRLQACIDNHQAYTEEVSANGMHVLWFPIWINDKVANCIQLSSPQPFDTQARQVIEGILGVYRNYQCLLDYSERDSLTGLLNRKTFDEKFSRMLASAPQAEDVPPQEQQNRRQRSDIREQWLAVVDIDHFKRVNDQFGHLYGDEVLILVANLLRSSFRSQDRIFRFGGEEFVVLLRSVTLDDARRIFERFRTNIENHNFPQVGRVTVSVGFASISSETPVVILGHADQALYHAKTHGRNQVCYYDELVETGLLSSEVANESVEFFFDDIVPAPGDR
jgi:diguanylate cyclase (GGDEF)-like protein